MPELPEIEAYLAALGPRVQNQVLHTIRVRSASLLRTYDPPIDAAEGRRITVLSRMGKRILFHFDQDLVIVIHLMIAGRFKWAKPGAGLPAKVGLAAFDFETGSLLLTEQGSKRRATMHVVRPDQCAALDPGGAELADLDLDGFRRRMTGERHTLKRSLSDARLFAGIGGAFGDEILWRAKLSPTRMSTHLKEEEYARLLEAAQATLAEWTRRRIEETGDGFPTRVTAFHPDMAVHGKYGKPCPACSTAIQRIVYGERETNYCPRCQTDGKILADRSLSRLLKSDWPRSIEALEEGG